MHHELPQNLESTRNLLAGSLQMHATEHAPTLPSDLLNDLSQRFNSAPVVMASGHTRSWFATLQSFVARPAFGVAALALVILGISVPNMIHSGTTHSSGGFRGAVTTTAKSQNLHIILIQAPSGFQKSLEAEGDFESGAISSTQSSAETATGPRILVDFASSTITAINSSDEKIHTAPLPENPADISAAIATAVSHL